MGRDDAPAPPVLRITTPEAALYNSRLIIPLQRRSLDPVQEQGHPKLEGGLVFVGWRMTQHASLQSQSTSGPPIY
jgi:hypothetical protein